MSFKKFIFENENKIQPRIFVDMDGVLCDIDAAFSKLIGKNVTLDEYMDKYGDDKAWDLIHDAGEDFWENMPWMPKAKKLWYFVKKYDPYILSAPSADESSLLGKVKWLKRNIPEANPENYVTNFKKLTDERVIFNPAKFTAITKSSDIKHLAGDIKTRSRRGDDVSEKEKRLNMLKKSFILIDDSKKRIDPWIEHGGTGILHTSAEDTISKLKDIL